MDQIALLMRNANTNEIIRLLVKGFDCDDGVLEDIYVATKMLILQEWGSKSAEIFSCAVDSTDGAFYIPQETTVALVLEEMEKVMD